MVMFILIVNLMYLFLMMVDESLSPSAVICGFRISSNSVHSILYIQVARFDSVCFDIFDMENMSLDVRLIVCLHAISKWLDAQQQMTIL